MAHGRGPIREELDDPDRSAALVAHPGAAAADIGGFRLTASHTWLPRLQLAVCLSGLGHGEHDCWHNEQAARVPKDPHGAHHRASFVSQGVNVDAIATQPGCSTDM